MAQKPPANSHSPQNMAIGAAQTFDIAKAVSRAELEKNPAPIYANHVQVTASASELLFDFFRLGPDPLNQNKMQAVYLQRVIVPLERAEGISQAITMSVSSLKDFLVSQENKEKPV